jgi:hypothetical protein
MKGSGKVIVVIIILCILCCCLGCIGTGFFVKRNSTIGNILSKDNHEVTQQQPSQPDRPDRPQMNENGPMMQERTEITLDEYKKMTTKVSYSDLTDDSEKWDGEDIEISVKITGTEVISSEQVYIGQLDGNKVYISDERFSASETINNGDDLVIYGKSARLITVVDDDNNETNIPLIKMFFIESSSY